MGTIHQDDSAGDGFVSHQPLEAPHAFARSQGAPATARPSGEVTAAQILSPCRGESVEGRFADLKPRPEGAAAHAAARGSHQNRSSPPLKTRVWIDARTDKYSLLFSLGETGLPSSRMEGFTRPPGGFVGESRGGGRCWRGLTEPGNGTGSRSFPESRGLRLTTHT